VEAAGVWEEDALDADLGLKLSVVFEREGIGGRDA